MRGEKGQRGYEYRFCRGSPPHARGKGRQGHEEGAGLGITPACAGKSLSLTAMWTYWKDHPRMRGEKNSFSWSRCGESGSPPHARGKVGNIYSSMNSEGITPACAGKSKPVPFKVRAIRDHPRMRGEKGAATGTGIITQGSPPHARGKAGILTTAGQQLRITPACAGKSSGFAHCGSYAEDHPRMRGEKECIRRECICVVGSPPHARGKASKKRTKRTTFRITPACAGKSAMY